MRARRGEFDRVSRLARALADVEEGTTYGAPALLTKGRMFACLAVHRSAEPDTLVVRVSFVERDLRIAAEPDTYYLTPHYQDHQTLLVRLKRASDEDLRELLETAREFVSVPVKRKRS